MCRAYMDDVAGEGELRVRREFEAHNLRGVGFRAWPWRARGLHQSTNNPMYAIQDAKLLSTLLTAPLLPWDPNSPKAGGIKQR